MMFSQYDRYFDHEADIGIIGRGLTVCEAFTDAAQSLFGMIAHSTAPSVSQCVEFEFEESDIEFAFVTYLNELISQFRSRHIVFHQFYLENKMHHWSARACGENWHKSMTQGVEVKGATLTMLSVKKCHSHWEARCVVDV